MRLLVDINFYLVIYIQSKDLFVLYQQMDNLTKIAY